MVANNNTYKASKNKHTTDEDNNKQNTLADKHTREALIKWKIQNT